MNDDNDTRFAATIKATLEDDLNRLDTRTVARLRAARRSALDRAGRRDQLAFPRYLRTAAAACVLGVAILVMWPQTDPAPLLASNTEDTEILLQSRDRIELYRDLDFYRWLAANEQRG